MQLKDFEYFRAFSLKEFVVNDEIDEIGKCCFMDCINLKKITFPQTCTTIKSHAFMGCDKLEQITFGDELETIEREAFVGCNSLKEVVLPRKMKTLEAYAFNMCYGIEFIVMPDEIENVSINAFYGANHVKVFFQGVTFDSFEKFHKYFIALKSGIVLTPEIENEEAVKTASYFFVYILIIKKASQNLGRLISI